jgi:phytoene desaturase
VARVVVVGAGLGGLAAAARLARLRHEVTVLEQADRVGGKLNTYTAGGFTWDTGPSLVTLPAALRDLFRKTGRPLDEVLQLVPVDPLVRYRFPDGTVLDLPHAGRHDVLAAIGDTLGGRAADEWGALLDRAGRMWHAVRRPFLEQPFGGWRTLARQVRDVRTVAPGRTLRGLGRRFLTDPRLRLLLDRYATYTGSDPRRAPAALAVIPYVEQTFGGWYVPGGLYRIAEAVRDRAVLRGAVVRTGSDVAAVTESGGWVDGVRLADGSRLAADLVVANADATHLYRDLLPRPRLVPRGQPSLSGFVVLLGLRGRTPGLRHHTVLFPTHYDAEFDAVFGREPRPPDDPAVYVSAPDDRALRPHDDTEAWFVLVNAPIHAAVRGRVDWDAPGLAAAYTDHVLDRLAERGLDVRDRVVVRETRTPADLARATRAPGGAIYGTASHGPRAAFLRPANRSPVRGLFLVGGSGHPGGGLPLVTLSAAIVAELIGRA